MLLLCFHLDGVHGAYPHTGICVPAFRFVNGKDGLSVVHIIYFLVLLSDIPEFRLKNALNFSNAYRPDSPLIDSQVRTIVAKIHASCTLEDDPVLKVVLFEIFPYISNQIPVSSGETGASQTNLHFDPLNHYLICDQTPAKVVNNPYPGTREFRNKFYC